MFQKAQMVFKEKEKKSNKGRYPKAFKYERSVDDLGRCPVYKFHNLLTS